MNVTDRLFEVQSKGGPAQVTQATELLAQHMTDPQTPNLGQEVDLLYDAYLNDPYLTREIHD
jgi:hypothetical protein